MSDRNLMLEKIHFRLAQNTQQDARQFCELSNSLYKRPVNEAYYYWQFFQCPFPSLLIVAIDDNEKIVGTYAIHIQNTQSESMKIAWVLDIMVSPHFQRRGIFRNLVDFGFENLEAYDVEAIVVMANDKAERACVNGLNWKLINTYMTYSVTPQPFHDKSQFVLEYEKVKDFSAFGKMLEANHFPLCANKRSAVFQNWRFAENPRYNYDVFLTHKRGKPFGYVVLKVFHDPVLGQSFGDVVDISWIENDKEALSDILHFSLAQFYWKKVTNCVMWLQTNTILDEVGVNAGFTQTEQKRFFCGKALKPDFKHLEEANSWFATLSDSEVY